MNLSHTAQESAAKLVVGPGVTLVGWLTLNDFALIVGIVSSLLVAGHTVWKWRADWQDRRARKAVEAAASS